MLLRQHHPIIRFGMALASIGMVVSIGAQALFGVGYPGLPFLFVGIVIGLLGISFFARRRSSLPAQSLQAALAAAYVGAFLLCIGATSFGIALEDGMFCNGETLSPSEHCTKAQITGEYLVVPIMALFAAPFALVLTGPTALALGRLVPRLEQQFKRRTNLYFQYFLGSLSGFAAMALLSLLLGEPSVLGILHEGADGVVAGFFGVLAFRRARYGPRIERDEEPNLDWLHVVGFSIAAASFFAFTTIGWRIYR